MLERSRMIKNFYIRKINHLRSFQLKYTSMTPGPVNNWYPAAYMSDDVSPKEQIPLGLGTTPAKPPETAQDWFRLEVQCNQIFTPHSPIDEQELFAGRRTLLNRLVDVVFQEGQHAVLFGERGVGKSSLANVLKEKVFAQIGTISVIKRNCTSKHNFKMIWQHIFSDFNYSGMPASDWLETHSNAFDVYQLIEAFASTTRPILIIDEFDRVTDQETKVMLADTIKYLSDYGSKATVIVVGVAHTMLDLFTGHASIARAIDQILLTRMAPEELKQILTTRFMLLNMNADDEAMQQLVALSQGLAGYTHLMGQAAAKSAIRRQSLNITSKDVVIAMSVAVEKSDDTIKQAYANAIRSTKPKNQYREALLSCALADTDERGFFSAAALRAPFSQIMGKKMDIPAFSRHLKEFCDPTRGPTLIKEGKPKSYLYSFAEPLMRPYVVINGVREGLITTKRIT